VLLWLLTFVLSANYSSSSSFCPVLNLCIETFTPFFILFVYAVLCSSNFLYKIFHCIFFCETYCAKCITNEHRFFQLNEFHNRNENVAGSFFQQQMVQSEWPFVYRRITRVANSYLPASNHRICSNIRILCFVFVLPPIALSER
jgi:hypothetical protein